MRGALLVLALLVPPAMAQEAPSASLRLLDFRFEPVTLAVGPGATVRLLNDGTDAHSYTSADESRFFDVVIAPGGATHLVVPASLGTIHVYCRFHASAQATAAQGMAGDLILTENPPPGGVAPIGGGATPLPALLAAAAVALASCRRAVR